MRKRGDSVDGKLSHPPPRRILQRDPCPTEVFIRKCSTEVVTPDVSGAAIPLMDGIMPGGRRALGLKEGPGCGSW